MNKETRKLRTGSGPCVCNPFFVVRESIQDKGTQGGSEPKEKYARLYEIGLFRKTSQGIQHSKVELAVE